MVIELPVYYSIVPYYELYTTVHYTVFHHIIMPPLRRGAEALGGHRHPSVRLSDVAYIGSNSKTKRPRKTKLCTWVPQVTCDSHTNFKVKSQGHGEGAYCGGHLAPQLVLWRLQ